MAATLCRQRAGSEIRGDRLPPWSLLATHHSVASLFIDKASYLRTPPPPSAPLLPPAVGRLWRGEKGESRETMCRTWTQGNRHLLGSEIRYHQPADQHTYGRQQGQQQQTRTNKELRRHTEKQPNRGDRGTVPYILSRNDTAPYPLVGAYCAPLLSTLVPWRKDPPFVISDW